nr:MAG TPA: hypothetical protein [Caudoviricetes sp.]
MWIIPKFQHYFGNKKSRKSRKKWQPEKISHFLVTT